jgi:acylphosphatase
MNRRVHATYEGWVQGVGFRFSAERAAASSGLSGWVKNLGDGRVELVCEGREADLKGFIAKIGSIFKTYIRDAEIEWSDATGEFDGFDIRGD